MESHIKLQSHANGQRSLRIGVPAGSPALGATELAYGVIGRLAAAKQPHLVALERHISYDGYDIKAHSDHQLISPADVSLAVGPAEQQRQQHAAAQQRADRRKIDEAVELHRGLCQHITQFNSSLM